MGAVSAWSSVLTVTPSPSRSWVKPLDSDGGDLGLDIAVDATVEGDASRSRGRVQSIRQALDGTRVVRTSARTPRTGTVAVFVSTIAEREAVHSALDHTGTVLLQFAPDTAEGENLYVRWVQDDSTNRLGPASDARVILQPWAEVDPP